MRLLLAALLFASLTTPLFGAPSFEGSALRVLKSISKVTMQVEDFHGKLRDSSCTAFSINEENHLHMSAAHCLGLNIHVAGEVAYPIYYNPDADLMVLFTPGLSKPALRPSKRVVTEMMPVASAGWGYGYVLPLFKHHVIAFPEIEQTVVLNYGQTTLKGVWRVTDLPYIGGMSGGPVFDIEGRVVANVQFDDTLTGWGRPIEYILELTARYWERTN